jgi:hypothetical protein
MSSAAYPQPEPVGAVVGVRDASLREARAGVVFSLCMVAALVVVSPHLTVLAVLATGEVVTSVYAAGRAVLTFRGRLDDAEPLPLEAFEATRRPERPPLDWKHVSAIAIGVAVTVGGVAFAPREWVARGIAAFVAVAIAQQLVRPLATAYLAARAGSARTGTGASSGRSGRTWTPT